MFPVLNKTNDLFNELYYNYLQNSTFNPLKFLSLCIWYEQPKKTDSKHGLNTTEVFSGEKYLLLKAKNSRSNNGREFCLEFLFGDSFLSGII
jgi:hypothetical protein